MDEIEIISIAIQETYYNQHIANLIEHLLLIDEKHFNKKLPEAK